eukprot:2506409-Rhodomonas_salina.1
MAVRVLSLLRMLHSCPAESTARKLISGPRVLLELCGVAIDSGTYCSLKTTRCTPTSRPSSSGPGATTPLPPYAVWHAGYHNSATSLCGMKCLVPQLRYLPTRATAGAGVSARRVGRAGYEACAPPLA